MGDDPFNQLVEAVAPLRSALLRHPVYQRVGELGDLRVFMRSHVFAVWDFMSLLKTLQRRLTCVDVPWLPVLDMRSARLVNEIVLAEETDEIEKDEPTSHFDLYLRAMDEVGADTRPILRFVRGLREGLTPEAALRPLAIPRPTRAFVLHTLAQTTAPAHEVAAAFLFGREQLVPAMFARMVPIVEQRSGVGRTSFRIYLERHVELDGEEHGPKAEMLLRNLCGSDPRRWEAGLSAALAALLARRALWDGVLLAMDDDRQMEPAMNAVG